MSIRTKQSEESDYRIHGTWLIQRLKKPSSGFGPFGKDNPFAFGGGLRNGGLSDEAMGLLRGIFSFDYMGSAEFEFGAVPSALRALAAKTDLTAWTVSVRGKRQPHWRARLTPKQREKMESTVVEADVFALASEAIKPHVAEVIAVCASGKERIKERSRVHQVLFEDKDPTYVDTTCGWLELDNGFFFFTDREMWEKTCALFGVTVDSPTRSAP